MPNGNVFFTACVGAAFGSSLMCLKMLPKGCYLDSLAVRIRLTSLAESSCSNQYPLDFIEAYLVVCGDPKGRLSGRSRSSPSAAQLPAAAVSRAVADHAVHVGGSSAGRSGGRIGPCRYRNLQARLLDSVGLS